MSAPSPEVDRPAPAPAGVVMTHPRLAALVEAARQRAGAQPAALALVHPCDTLAMEAVQAARASGIARPVLVGHRGLIERAADAAGVDLSDCEIHAPDREEPAAAARLAVDLVRRGGAGALMKGSLHTDELMSAVVAREHGLRGERRISHAFLFDLPRYHKLLALADCVVNIAPDLRTKVDILGNAVALLRRLGIAEPRVGIVAAVETVNPAIPATLDAQSLCAMAASGTWGTLRVEGPMGLDIALSAQAARIKKLPSEVAGDPDLLLMPDLNAGNMLYKGFNYIGGGDCAGLVLGARVPIVLTSRADSLQSRLASMALATLAAD